MKNKTNIPANHGNLHFIHHTSNTDILLCINNVSSLDPPTKQPPTTNMHYHKLLNIDFYAISSRNRLLWHYATSNLLHHYRKPRSNQHS